MTVEFDWQTRDRSQYHGEPQGDKPKEATPPAEEPTVLGSEAPVEESPQDSQHLGIYFGCGCQGVPPDP